MIEDYPLYTSRYHKDNRYVYVWTINPDAYIAIISYTFVGHRWTVSSRELSSFSRFIQAEETL